MAAWQQWVLGAAALVGAFGVLFRTLRPVIKLLARLDDAMPILFQIADQFNPAEGKGLKDHLTRIEESLEEVRKTTLDVKKAVNGT